MQIEHTLIGNAGKDFHQAMFGGEEEDQWNLSDRDPGRAECYIVNEMWRGRRCVDRD